MKYVYLVIAYLALAIAFLGVVLPGLPATEFFLLAAWAAGKGSPRLHRWMINHKMIGPPLKNWQQHGIISVKTKLLASISMLLAAVFLYLKVTHLPSLIFCLAGMSLGILWLWSRPSQSDSTTIHLLFAHKD